jgi:hypothetical protein
MDKRWARLTPEQKKQRSNAVQRCRSNRYRRLKELAGGKCVVCGYSRCFRALEFHHTDPNCKEFGLSVLGTTRSWIRILTEAAKCAFVCSNCHREIEDKFLPSPKPLGKEWVQRVLKFVSNRTPQEEKRLI